MSRVSVIMPAYNAALTIAAAIASVQAQSHADWELLCIDDASHDATRELIAAAAAADPRIRLLAVPRNQGAARARNLGLDAAEGGFVAFLDADDLWLPDKLARQLPTMVAGARFSYAAYAFLAAGGGVGRRVVPPPRLDFARACRGNPIGHLTVMLDRAWLGPRRFPLRGHEDYALWLRLLRELPEAQRAGDDSPLALYRRSGTSLSANKWRALGWTWGILREEAGLSLPVAGACLAAHAWRGIAKHYL